MSTRAQVPLTDLDDGEPERFEQLMRAVEGVARSGKFIGGAAVAAFEREWAEWCDVPHAVGVSSGTDALVLALRALGISSGDAVVVPANSFIATAEAVSLVGATPRFADVDERTHLITAATLERALTPAVRCVIPVHLYGRTVELEPIMRLARRHRLAVVEDCSQAHGARYRGQRVGSIGHAGTFSFYPAKNLGAWGDAGAVISRDGQLAERVQLLRSHGERPRYHHRLIGTTARLDAVQAAVLSCKVAQLEGANERRRKVAEALRERLADCGLTLPEPADRDGDHVYHQFVVRARRRDELRRFLSMRGIATGVHYPVPIHRSEAYRASWSGRDPAPVATRLAGEVLSLPMFPALGAREIRRIGAAVTAFQAPMHGPRLAAVEGGTRPRLDAPTWRSGPRPAAPPRSDRAERLYRALDLLIAGVCLTVTAPLLALACLAIRLESPGPVIFRQRRLGRSRRPFTVHKLRTMCLDASSDVHRRYVGELITGAERTTSDGRRSLYKLTGDERVTRVGRVLRRTSVDELPQLVDVWRGHMSIVGPRPVTVYEAELYPADYEQRFAVKPGITGLWQVSGRNQCSYREMVALDIAWAHERSPRRYLSIVARTPWVLLRAQGAA